jgi:hypothetical protein
MAGEAAAQFHLLDLAVGVKALVSPRLPSTSSLCCPTDGPLVGAILNLTLVVASSGVVVAGC